MNEIMNLTITLLKMLFGFSVVMLVSAFLYGMFFTLSFKIAMECVKDMLKAMPALLLLILFIFGISTVITLTLCNIYA